MLALAGRPAGRVLAAWTVIVLPWAAFSWLRLGSLVPDTLLIKVSQGPWGGRTFATGVAMYLERYPAATVGSLLLLPAVPFAAMAVRDASSSVRRAIGALALYGVAHFGVYTLLGVPPYHWYYTHQVVPIVVCGALGAAWLARRWARPPLLAYASAALPVIVLAAVLAPTGLRHAPIHTNWALPREYQAIGEGLRGLVEPSAVVDLRGEIGTIAYYSERMVVDPFADPNQVSAGIERLTERLPPGLGWLGEANFARRRRPEPFAAPSYVLNSVTDVETAIIAEDAQPLATWDVSSTWVPHPRVFLYRAEP
ncbi:MAG: hypothetical protein ACRD0K_06185 [Egibacteraceae bacterium]